MKPFIYWLIGLIAFFIALEIFKYNPEFIETFYSNSTYHYLNIMLTNILGWIPFPVGDFLYFFTALYLLIMIIRSIRNKRNWKFYALFIVKATTLFLLLFNLSWGLNNYRISLSKKIQIDNNYTTLQLDFFTNLLIEEVNKQHEKLTFQNTSQPITLTNDLSAYHLAAIEGYNATNEIFKLPIKNIAPTHPSLYSYFLTKSGFSGYFNPFTHETQINDQVPLLGKPITVAHEIAHQLGIAKESEANFIGFMVMHNQSNATYKYCALVYALRYCLKEVLMTNEEKYLHFYQKINPGIRENIEESERFWKENKNFSSLYFKSFYNSFLKINNQSDGIRSYNRFVDLLINYHKKNPNMFSH